MHVVFAHRVALICFYCKKIEIQNYFLGLNLLGEKMKLLTAVFFTLALLSTGVQAYTKRCASFSKNKIEFLKRDTRKYPDKSLIVAIDIDPRSCAIKYNPSIKAYWKAKSGKASKLGYDCSTPASVIRSVAKPTSIKKISSCEYELGMDSLEGATQDLSQGKLGRIVTLKSSNRNGKYNIKTNL